MPRAHHGNGIAHRIARGRHEDRGQQQDRQRHEHPTRQRLGHRQRGDVEAEVLQRLAEIDEPLKLIEDARAAEQREPHRGRQRREDRHRDDHLANGAALGDPRHEDRHQRCIADEPGEEEHRPPLHPPARRGLRGHRRHLEERAQVGTESLEPGIDEEQGRPEEQDDRSDSHRQHHVEAAEDLDAAIDARDGRGHVDGAQHGHDDQLGAVAVRHPEELVKAEADLSGEKADRPDRSRHQRDDADRIDNAAQHAANTTLAKHRRQQRARLQRQAAMIVLVRQHDGRQRTEYGPGQETPVHERLCQGMWHGSCGVGFAIEGRRRDHEVVDRLARGEEHAATGQQRTQNDRDPLERAHLGAIGTADPRTTGRRERHADGDEERQQQQPLEKAAEGTRCPGEARSDGIGHGTRRNG